MTDASDIDWLRGAAYGVIAYLTAFVFTALWYYFDYSQSPINVSASTEEIVGLGVGSFYNGQFVVGGDNLLAGLGTAGHGFLLTIMYRIIPVLGILLIAGAFVYAETDAKDRLEAFLSGASLAPGYVVVSLVVVLAFRQLAGSDFLPIGMTIVSGVLYPVVVGGLAGLAANEVKGYVEDSSPTRGVEENM